MKFSEGTNYKYSTVVRHQGVSIVLALSENSDIYYRVLALDPTQPEDDKCWSDAMKLAFADQIRPSGMSLVTVALKTAERTADAPFQAVSDGKHVYLFRQSTDCTLYVDRFIFDSAENSLNPNWETRFQRSNKRDIAASRKDTAGAVGMEGGPFLEPTTELTFIKDVQEGRFSVLLLPGRLPSEWRWQMFVTNVEGVIDSYSIRRSEDGLFDVSDIKQNSFKWADQRDRFQTGPAALLYMQQEEASDENGRLQRFKRAARVMLAAPVGSSKYALELDGVDDFVGLKNPDHLQIEGEITVEAWVKTRDLEKEQYIMAHGTTGISLKIDSGKYKFGCQDRYAECDIPTDDLNEWIHLAGAYDREQQKWLLYRNAEKVGDLDDSTGATTVAEDWFIGKSFKGQINNVRLWNLARSAGEIQAFMYQPLSGQESGLVGCWPLDEGSGDIVFDQVADNQGQLDLGYALKFDGIDDYVQLPEMTIDYSNGFTVEAWVRYDSFQDNSKIIDFGNGESQDNILFNNGAKSNNLEFQVLNGESGQVLIANGILEKDTWMHLAATIDNNDNAAIYKNGKLQVIGKVHKPKTAIRKMNYIGRSNWIQDGYFDGSMREVRVWNVARSEEQISAAMNHPVNGDEEGLVGHWPLNECSGNTISDQTSKHLYDGTLHLGYAIDFDGYDDYVDVADNASLAINQAITVEARIKHLVGDGHIVNRGGGWSDSGYSLFIYRGNIRVELQNTSCREKTIVDNPMPTDGTWHYLAFTWDSTSRDIKTYVDGELQPIKGKFTGPIGVPSQNLNIGRNEKCGNYFHGSMHDVKVWNTARTQEEIQRDMYGPPAEDETGLVGWWVPLNKGLSDTIHDKASGNHGTFVSGCKKESTCLTFDGKDDHVELQEMDIDFSGGLTIEAWVRYNSFKKWSRIIDLGNGESQDNILFANQETNKVLVFQVYKNKLASTITVSGTLEEKTWMHLAATVDQDGNAALYKNGKQLQTGSIHVPATLNRTKNYIGRSNWVNDGYFDGDMKEVRIWKVARSVEEIKADMNHALNGDEQGLVAYWPLDEGEGTEIKDNAGGYNGKLWVGTGDDPESKWGTKPSPPDDPVKKWIAGFDNADEKWAKGSDDPKNKWVVVAPIAILDFGVSRDGSLALIDDMENRSEAILARKNGNGAANLVIPVLEKGESQMRVIKMDQKGLTFSAGLLNYAHSGDRPFLLDSADGLIHLYFRGDYSNFLVTQLDTLTARVSYALPLNGTATSNAEPQLQFIARQPGTHMQNYKISIMDGSTDDSCLLTIDGQNGKEEWKEVPRDLELFLAVINGTAPNKASDPLVEEDELYDYAGNVTREGVPDLTTGITPFWGSTLFGVIANNLPDTGEALPTVPNIESVKMADNGLDCAWIPEPMGKALQFDGTDDYVELPHEKLAIAGDMTLEAWVKINEKNSNTHQRLIHYHSGDSRFTLGLIKKDDDYNTFAACRDIIIKSEQIRILPGEWTHLAAVYNATNALKLDGQGYADCGNDITLDMSESLTVEAWVTPEMNESPRPEVLLSKWGTTEDEQSWRLYIDAEGKACFEIRDQQRKLIRTQADAPLQKDQSYHLAGVFDAAPKKEIALEFNGTNDFVGLENPDIVNFDGAITIEAWIYVQDTDHNGYIVAHGVSAGLTFLRVSEGKIQIGSRKQSNDNSNLAEYIIPPEDKDTWVHLAGVYDSDEKEKAWILYRNGIEMNRSEQETFGAVSSDKEWAIGRRGADNSDYFKGRINNVRIWNRARSAEEICENMDKTDFENKAGLVGHWVFDQTDQLLASLSGVQDHSNNDNIGKLNGSLGKDSFVDIDKCSYKQSILVDGILKSQCSVGVANKIKSNTTKVNIGRSAADEWYFHGIIDDTRLWNIGRREWQIQYYKDQTLPGNADGLVSRWHFEEGHGKIVMDAEGSNHGRLVHTESDKIETMWTPVPRNASLILYVNGREAQTTDANFDYGTTNQFTIGAMSSEIETHKDFQDFLNGCIDDVRIWSEVRTVEQIRDNMYRGLSGAEENLAGYWPLDEGEGEIIQDRTGNGQLGALHGAQWIDSTAPIGNEAPEVRNVYGGLEKPGFSKQILGSPAAVEYSDMQWDAYGKLFGVMKRCCIVPEGIIQLITGFKVGDLELNFICQVQTEPTLIGYIEGAPPVPSENLTVNDPKTDDYVGASSIQLTEAKETTQVYYASRDTGFDMSIDAKAGVHWAYCAEAGGMFVSTKVMEKEGVAGVHAYFEHSLGHLSSATKTVGTSKTLAKSLVLCGGWEEELGKDANGNSLYLNPDVGRRYLPNNMGYALVKSSTADLFALRLKRSGSLVAFQIMPNPDIPEDWNIIMFPLNPKYIKNGTLDGMVGLVADSDYPSALAGERGSYFKPLEAYALKRQIEREAENIKGYYDSFKAGEIGRKSTSSGESLEEMQVDYDWATGKDKRNMANTYVWTADGGFYAEEEQFSSIRQESLGGSYHFLGQGGVYSEGKFAAGFGFYYELDALFGGHINVEVSKSEEEKAAFGMHVEVQGEGFLNKWEGDQDKKNGEYTAEPCPGKVDAYRFMTFYLAPKPNNFDKFFEQVVDPEWLNGQGKYAGEYSANARALREARYKPNQVWRVLHRVTYVSRIPPEFEPAPLEVVPQDVLRPANVQANIGLIQHIERIRHLLLPIPNETLLMELGRAINKLLGDISGDCQSELENIVPWWSEINQDAKREIRQDMMTYLKDFYLSDLTLPEIETEKKRVTEGLQVLYTFEEGTGTIVKDVSDIGSPLDLTIKDKDAVSWIQSGGLAITGETFVTTSKPATKLIRAAKLSNEITVEALIKPANVAQGKPAPARIVTLSSKTGRNFMLGQYGESYLIRLCTTETKDDGSDKELEAGNVNTEKLSHLIYVREASGKAWFYLNGVEVGQHEVPGDFSNWDNSYRFALGNEYSGALPRPWKGEFHLVAIYSRALDPAEVMQNYKAGASNK